jgi:membrane associated rhomboid family serine protease
MAVPDAAEASRLAVPVAGLVVLLVVYALDRPGEEWGPHLRRRFLLGVPWGTLVSIALVLGVYLFVQGGWSRPSAPVTIPFRAWSYFYPLGMVTAGFAHSGPGHLVGNLVGTAALAPIAEYVWGHYPRRRGVQTFTSPLTNPYVRAFVVVPAAVVAGGLLTAAFSLGPIIGFSGVVFAFGGVALVRYPILTVVALSASDGLGTFYRALQSPTVTASAGSTYSTPWWAQIAIQGHALGLLVGVLVGVWLVRSRDEALPSAGRVAAGVVLFGIAQSLWAVYWYRGGETYVLYRAAGLALVVLLAALVAVAVAASDRPLVAGVREGMLSVPRWQVGGVALLLCTATIAGPAVPVNLTTAAGGDMPGETVEIRGYEVTYAEGVPNGMVSAIDVEAFGETTQVNTSGVIVRNRERGIWLTVVSTGRLAFDGAALVRVGGVGWRETVRAERTGWNAVGGGATYRIRLSHDNRTVTPFVSPPARAGPVVGGRNLSIEATRERFLLNVSTGEEFDTVPVPPANESRTVGGLTVVNDGGRLVATSGGTKVRVATRERYD